MPNFFSQFGQSFYWFNARPPYDFKEVIFYLSFFTLIMLGTILLKIAYDKKGKQFPPYNFFRQKYFSPLLTCSIIGFVLLSFRWQGISYLSNRILLIGDFFIVLVLLTFFSIYQFKKLPRQLENHQNQLNYQKYLPKPKNKASRKK